MTAPELAEANRDEIARRDRLHHWHATHVPPLIESRAFIRSVFCYADVRDLFIKYEWENDPQ